MPLKSPRVPGARGAGRPKRRGLGTAGAHRPLAGGSDGSCSRYRSWHHQLRDRRDGGGQAHRDTQRRGIADDALGGGVHPAGGAPGGPARPPAGDPEPQGHHLFGEAVHRAALRRGHQRAERRVVRRGPRARRRRAVRDHGPGVRAGGDLGPGAAQAHGRRVEVPGREGHRGGHHRAGLLQRRPAAGDQGRRAHRRARGAAHHQRADRRRPRLRPGQEEQRDRAGLRPGRRDLRRQHPRHRRRRGRGPGHRGRHPPRRGRLRPPHRRPPGRRVPAGQRHRPADRPAGPAAPVRGGREGQGRAVLGDPDAPSACRSSPPTRPVPSTSTPR